MTNINGDINISENPDNFKIFFKNNFGTLKNPAKNPKLLIVFETEQKKLLKLSPLTQLIILESKSMNKTLTKPPTIPPINAPFHFFFILKPPAL